MVLLGRGRADRAGGGDPLLDPRVAELPPRRGGDRRPRALGGLPRTMHEVWSGESTPPLYYLLAWLWSHLFGVGEVGLRVALGPVRHRHGAGRLPGRARAVGRRAGLALAAIVAVEPAAGLVLAGRPRLRAVVLLSAAAFLFFLRARRGGRAPATSPAGRSVSALALATHYFAFFPLAIEAAWLLAAARPLRRGWLWALGGVALTGRRAGADSACTRPRASNNDWIASFGLRRPAARRRDRLLRGRNGPAQARAGPACAVRARRSRCCCLRRAREKRGARGRAGGRRRRHAAGAASSPPPARTSCWAATCCRRWSRWRWSSPRGSRRPAPAGSAPPSASPWSPTCSPSASTRTSARRFSATDWRGVAARIGPRARPAARSSSGSRATNRSPSICPAGERG